MVADRVNDVEEGRLLDRCPTLRIVYRYRDSRVQQSDVGSLCDGDAALRGQVVDGMTSGG